MEKTFASDNFSGAHPKVLENIIKINNGHHGAYGTDEYTDLGKKIIIEKLGANKVYFMLNGTGTNITILDSLTNNYGAVICSNMAHILTHESGAASKIANITLLPVDTTDGKITIDGIKPYLYFKESYHFPKPQVISISQPTEMGAVYTVEELKELTSFAHEHGLKVHMDGARISNAAAFLNVSLKEMTYWSGIDALSFGMAKNGIMFGEAAVFFNESAPADFDYIRKQNLQLQSKMRFISGQYLTILKDDLWLENARIANENAEYLAEKLSEVDEVEIVQKPSGNIMYVKFPKEINKELQNFMYFYIENEESNMARLVTNFDTLKGDIDSFIEKTKKLIVK